MTEELTVEVQALQPRQHQLILDFELLYYLFLT